MTFPSTQEHTKYDAGKTPIVQLRSVLFICTVAFLVLSTVNPVYADKVSVDPGLVKAVSLNKDAVLLPTVGRQRVSRAFDGSLNPVTGFVTRSGSRRGRIVVDFATPVSIGSIAIWNDVFGDNNAGIGRFYVKFEKDGEIVRSRNFYTATGKEGDTSQRGYSDQRNGPDHFGFRQTHHNVQSVEIVILYPTAGYRAGDHLEVREIAFFDTRDVDTYLLAGQSNASGIWMTGSREPNSAFAIKATREDMISQLQWNYPSHAEFEPDGVSAVSDYYKCGRESDHSIDECRDLNWGTPRKQKGPRGNTRDSSGASVKYRLFHYGPEISFLRCSARITENWQYLHKFAVPGQSIVQWVGQAGTDFTPRYDNMMKGFSDQLEALRTAGLNPVVRGVVWIQGETDARSAAFTGQYESRLTRFVDQVRRDLATYSDQGQCVDQNGNLNAEQCAPFVFSFQDKHGTFEYDESIAAEYTKKQQLLSNLRTIRLAQERVSNSVFVDVQDLRYLDSSDNHGWGDRHGHLTANQINSHGTKMCEALHSQ